MHMHEPDFEAMLLLRVKPAKKETRAQQDKRLHALIFCIEYLFPKVVGSKNWRQKMCTMPLSLTGLTASDEAFAITCYDNMKEIWQAPQPATPAARVNGGSTPLKTYSRGKYTSQGSNRKYGGWSKRGIEFYNERFDYVVKTRAKKWAQGVETEAMEALRERYYKHASLDDIRKSKTRKRKKLGDDDDDLEQSPPKAAWDESKVVLSSDSESDEDSE